MKTKSVKAVDEQPKRVARGSLRRMVMRPTVLTAKQLREYVPGAGCRCAAWNSSECACPKVDWTPTEIYKLRLSQRELRRQIRNLKKFEAASKRANLIVGKPHTVRYAKCAKLKNNMNEAKLKACPFCGKPATVETTTIKDKEYYAIGCDNVACRGSAWAGDPDAVRAVSRWNERAGDRKPTTAKTPAISTLASSNGSVAAGEIKFVIEKLAGHLGMAQAQPENWRAYPSAEQMGTLIACLQNAAKHLPPNTPLQASGADDARKTK